ncbi:NAD(+)/NADH kinase [Gallalistipes aquisgranensis]|uniref:NAD(+)/NADH kinase n=1 Tax=Gallalistipes aquisgranensis TaxID=2779358 RepID=UPI001CF8C181|nr:NAD(+)/NADH kinase [Gallalistipes aquisgranensis]MBE5033351.1 NAD(+)/NADH kinase [Gallalistipes aquisgranensis]
MEILLYSRPRATHDGGELGRLLEALDRHGFRVCMNRELAEATAALTGIRIPESKQYASLKEACPDARMLICYGGDGTFLDGVRMLDDRSIPVLGINSGRLGFLANVPREGIDRALEDIREGHYSIESRPLLRAEGDFPEGAAPAHAFNEFSLQRSGASMIAVEAYVNDEMVATYWGDGVLLSTPSGSTAYSLSVGGPVVAPGCDCLVLSPIAPHNLTMRPVVVPGGSLLTFRVSTREERALATLDNRNYPVRNGATFRVSKSKNSVFLVRLQNISFYDTLRNKMMWGFDRRDETK